MTLLNVLAYLSLMFGFTPAPETVEDDTPPIAVCFANLNVSLDLSGEALLPGDALDAGSSDDTGIASFSLSQDYFTCADIGAPIPVIMTVTDLDGNTNSCWGNILIEDKISPTMVCLATVNATVDAGGSVTITPDMLDGGSFDNCSINFSIPPTTYTCADVGSSNTILLTGTDPGGNTNTCWSTVNVVDNILPTARCKDSVRSLSKSGRYKPKINHINDGSFDNCGIASMTVSPTIFFCSDVGPQDVVLTVTDESGNVSTCVALVEVVDAKAPKIRCPQDITVPGTVNCVAAVTYTVLYADNCPGAILIQGEGLPSGANFPVGTTTNTYKVIDVSGNLKECSFDVTVTDPGGCVPAAPTAPAGITSGFDLSNSNLSISPNPFGARTAIQYQIEAAGTVQLEIYDLNGQQIWLNPATDQMAGFYQLDWSTGPDVQSGLYVLVMRVNGEVQHQKVMVIER